MVGVFCGPSGSILIFLKLHTFSLESRLSTKTFSRLKLKQPWRHYFFWLQKPPSRATINFIQLFTQWADSIWCLQTIKNPFTLKNIRETRGAGYIDDIDDLSKAVLDKLMLVFNLSPTSCVSILDNISSSIRKTNPIFIWTEDQDPYSLWFLKLVQRFNRCSDHHNFPSW